MAHIENVGQRQPDPMRCVEKAERQQYEQVDARERILQQRERLVRNLGRAEP